MDFRDSYILKWKLRNEFGAIYDEKHENISLSDFEIIYGNNVNEIIELEMRLIV